MDIPRPEKLLIAMYQLAGDTNRPLEYEDIVVKSWQLFPEEFGLRKYVHTYPDSSDQHKPLYGPLKDKGFVLSGNKKFRLTEKGIFYASELERAWKGLIPLKKALTKPDRLSRDKESQLRRLWGTEAFRLFVEGQQERILDTDFYTYIGATVRTEKHEFQGQLKTVADAVADAARISDDTKTKTLKELHSFLVKKFAEIIEKNKIAK